MPGLPFRSQLVQFSLVHYILNVPLCSISDVALSSMLNGLAPYCKQPMIVLGVTYVNANMGHNIAMQSYNIGPRVILQHGCRCSSHVQNLEEIRIQSIRICMLAVLIQVYFVFYNILKGGSTNQVEHFFYTHSLKYQQFRTNLMTADLFSVRVVILFILRDGRIKSWVGW